MGNHRHSASEKNLVKGVIEQHCHLTKSMSFVVQPLKITRVRHIKNHFAFTSHYTKPKFCIWSHEFYTIIWINTHTDTAFNCAFQCCTNLSLSLLFSFPHFSATSVSLLLCPVVIPIVLDANGLLKNYVNIWFLEQTHMRIYGSIKGPYMKHSYRNISTNKNRMYVFVCIPNPMAQMSKCVNCGIIQYKCTHNRRISSVMKCIMSFPTSLIRYKLILFSL